MVSRSELATRVARGGASHSQAMHAVDAVLHEITAALAAGERVALTGFGTFEPVARPARAARNPRTGAPVQVPAATVARFHAGAALRAALLAGDAGAAPAGSLPAAGGHRETAVDEGGLEPAGGEQPRPPSADDEPASPVRSGKQAKVKKGSERVGRDAAEGRGSKKPASAKKRASGKKHAGDKKASAAKKSGGKKAKTRR